jgi:hypothetical protein
LVEEGDMRLLVIALLVMAGTGVAFAGCPDGFTFNTVMKVCEITPSCSEGFTLHPIHDICTAKPDAGKCPQGSSFNVKENSCETPLTCPPGTVFMEQIDKCILK